MEKFNLTIANLLGTLRPKTLTASLAPMILALALLEIPVHWPHVIAITICTLLMQIGANLTNDYYDVQRGVDSSERVGPLRALQKGKLDLKTYRKISLLSFLIAFIIGCYLSLTVGVEIFILGLICMATAYFYSGGSRPLSHYMLGEMIAFIFFGPVAVLGILWILQQSFSEKDFFLSLFPGFISALMMGLNNQRDAASDRQAKKWTIASVWGEGFARSCNLFFLIMTLLLPLLYIKVFYLPWTIMLVIFPFLILSKSWWRLIKGAKKSELIPILEASGQYFFFYHLVLALGLKL